MKQSRRILDFYKRWNIHLDIEAEFLRFKNRILKVMDEVIGEHILRNPKIDDEYCFSLGLKPQVKATSGFILTEPIFELRSFNACQIYKALDSTENEYQLITALQQLLWIFSDDSSYSKRLTEGIQMAIDWSPLINIRIVTRKNQISLYPKGARSLDERLVNDNLDWLESHEKLYSAFEAALKSFAKNDPSEYSNVINNMRFALEGLLKRILKNRKRLEKQKKFLEIWLKQKGLHKELRKMVQSIVDNIASYNNDFVKHENPAKATHKPSLSEVEFVIYQTGVLIRLLLELNDDN